MPDAFNDLGLNPGAIEAIVHARHGDPFAVLGPHDGSVRAFIPGADSVTVVDRDTGIVAGELQRLHPAGFFAGTVGAHGPYRLRVQQGAAQWETEDPYAFPPVLGDLDVYLLAEGRHLDFGRALGAHPAEMDGIPGVRFAVWAPNAQRCLGCRRLQRVGRPRPSDAQAPRAGRVGTVHPPHRRRARSTNTRCSARKATCCR